MFNDPEPDTAPTVGPDGLAMGSANGIPYCFGLAADIIAHLVPRRFATAAHLIKEINIYAPKSCKYMDDCPLSQNIDNTNWRKAMSHIFGRNKNCTRCVPDEIWCSFCRKHYQRARYRNNLEYNKQLCYLVEVQITRVEAWSLENIRLGQSELGAVRDWALTCRRREQVRIEEAKSKKRSHDDNASDDGFDSPITVGNNAQVPQWLLELCRPGYSTLEILRIVARIADELDNGGLPQLPDIEILPNITGSDAKPKPKPKAKTKTSTPHKRAQSMGNAAQATASLGLSSSRRVSQPSSYFGGRGNGNGYRQDNNVRPSSKRQRFSENEEEDGYEEDPRFPPRTLGRTVPNIRPLPTLTPQGARFHDELAPVVQYGYGAPATGGPGPLPTPRSSQYNNYPEASGSRTLGQGYDEYRARGPHTRAFSDASNNNFSWPSTSAGPTPGMHYPEQQPNGYSAFYAPATNTGYAAAYTRDEYAAAPRHGNNTGYAQGYYQHQQPYHAQQGPHGSYYGPPGGGVKHMRHQSTPTSMLAPAPPHHAQPQASRVMGPPPLHPAQQQPQQQANGYDQAYFAGQHGRHMTYVPSAVRDNVVREPLLPETGAADAASAVDAGPGPAEGYEAGYPAGVRR